MLAHGIWDMRGGDLGAWALIRDGINKSISRAGPIQQSWWERLKTEINEWGMALGFPTVINVGF